MLHCLSVAGQTPYPPRFNAKRHPLGMTIRVRAERSGRLATYQSTGVCWKPLDAALEAREFDTGANLYLGSLDVDNPQEG